MHPSYGVLADVAQFFGASPVDWFAQYPLFSITLIVAWQWLPFATLILLTSLQSLNTEQMEAAEMDGASVWRQYWQLTMPLVRPALAALATLAAANVHAQIKVGVSISTTGPAAALGIPERNALDFVPKEIGGEKVVYIALDDESDPTKGTQNARRLVIQDGVDILIG